ncbi:hypothetical protein TNCV_2152141 [Trichonephila clavipes]|nr:hypothetical protein TNCV_2152141 [Trichonephila clavipes]
MQLPSATYLWPLRAEQASQDLHHCSTSALTLPQQNRSRTRCKVFHDAEMTSCWAAMQFFLSTSGIRDRGSTNCHLNVFFHPLIRIFGIEHHSEM